MKTTLFDIERDDAPADSGVHKHRQRVGGRVSTKERRDRWCGKCKASTPQTARRHGPLSRNSGEKWWDCSRCEVRRKMVKFRRQRKEALERYGGACWCCGEGDDRFLTFDHINDDGYMERFRRGGRSAFLRSLLAYAKREDIRVMCFNCNCGREVNDGRCPHEETGVRVRWMRKADGVRSSKEGKLPLV